MRNRVTTARHRDKERKERERKKSKDESDNSQSIRNITVASTQFRLQTLFEFQQQGDGDAGSRILPPSAAARSEVSSG